MWPLASSRWMTRDMDDVEAKKRVDTFENILNKVFNVEPTSQVGSEIIIAFNLNKRIAYDDFEVISLVARALLGARTEATEIGGKTLVTTTSTLTRVKNARKRNELEALVKFHGKKALSLALVLSGSFSLYYIVEAFSKQF